jgi:hypothetical protein
LDVELSGACTQVVGDDELDCPLAVDPRPPPLHASIAIVSTEAIVMVSLERFTPMQRQTDKEMGWK